MKNTKLLIYICSTIIVVLLMIIILHKKNDYTEISQNAYVSSIGIDYNLEDNTYTVYLYILNNYNIGQSEYGTSQSDSLAYISKGTDKSISSSISNIKQNSNIKLQLSHIRSMVLTQRFFNSYNLNMLINFIKYSPDIYPTFNIYTTNDDLMDIYNIQNFTETSGYYTILTNNDGVNDPLHVTSTTLINDYLINYYTGTYPILKVSNDTFYDGDKPYTSLYISGYSFLNKDNRLSCFNFNNIKGLIYLNELKRNTLSYQDFDFFVNEYNKKITIKKNKLYIFITLHGILINCNLDAEYDHAIKILKNNIINEIISLKELMDSYNIDIFNVVHLSNNTLDYNGIDIEVNVHIY